MTKYILYPGFVVSKHDRERHYVGAQQLARLFGVDMRECITAEPSARFSSEFLDKLIPLRPRPSGNYTLKAEDES